MSVYSTIEITRSDAVEAILNKVLTASDEKLESMMFDLYGQEGIENTLLARFSITSNPSSNPWNPSDCRPDWSNS
jgi:hypothetical protein